MDTKNYNFGYMFEKVAKNTPIQPIMKTLQQMQKKIHFWVYVQKSWKKRSSTTHK